MQKFPVNGDNDPQPMTFSSAEVNASPAQSTNTVTSGYELANHTNTTRPAFQQSGQMDKIITALPVVNDLLKSAAMLTQNCKDLISLFRSLK
jgi:hypothetical protein